MKCGTHATCYNTEQLFNEIAKLIGQNLDVRDLKTSVNSLTLASSLASAAHRLASLTAVVSIVLA